MPDQPAWPPVSSGGGYAVSQQGTVVTAFGASQTINFAGLQQEIRIAGLLTADTTLNVTNRVAGSRLYVEGIQDGTGGHAFSITDGTTTAVLQVPQSPGGYFSVQVDFPDSTNFLVTPLSQPVGVLLQSNYDALLDWDPYKDLTAALIDPVGKQGTWSFAHSSTANGQLDSITNGTGAQGDFVSFYLPAAQGTYDVNLLGVLAAGCAQVTVQVGTATAAGVLDFFGTTTANQIRSSTITLPANGRQLVTLTAATRNASNTTAWTMQLSHFYMKRTS